MAATVSVTQIELASPTFEPLSYGEAPSTCYPLPDLEVTSEGETRTFDTVVIENERLRATFLPQVGGRLIELIDKRTGSECLGSKGKLTAERGSLRGFWIPEGVQWGFGDGPRLQSMAEVDVQIVAVAEDGSAKFAMFELGVGTGISWHLWVSLAADEARLKFELRALNRTLEPIDYAMRLHVQAASNEVVFGQGAIWTYDESSRRGMAILAPPGTLENACIEDQILLVTRRFPGGKLAPRQTDHLSFSLMPLSGMPTVSSVSEYAALSVQARGLQVWVNRDLPGSKVFLLTASGETLESPVDLSARQESTFELGLIEPQRILLRGSEGQSLVQWPLGTVVARPGQDEDAWKGFDADQPAEVVAALRDTRLRAGAAVAAAHLALQSDAVEEAKERVEDALLFNGDDPLAWWLKAALDRKSGQESDCLLNAHFLAPMEPVLRVESFLRQRADDNSGSSALLSRLCDSPDQLVEAVCMFLQAGLVDDAEVVLDEVIRLRDLTMFRLLRAFILVRIPELRSEAAIQVAAGDRMGFSPPLPWRAIEVKALAELNEAFPGSAVIERFQSLATRARAGKVS